MYIGDAGYTDTYRIGTFIVKMPILEILSLQSELALDHRVDKEDIRSEKYWEKLSDH